MTVDIIVPCYYQSSVIYPCLQSIAEQTVIKDITVIMVNDCSPYTNCNYQDLIDEFSSSFKITYLKTDKNSGPGIARQLGLDNATSDWVMFVDDDDELLNSYSIETLLNQANLEDTVFVSGQSILISADDDSLFEIHEPWGHHHGTIYNRQILKNKNIHYEPMLSYFEEDGAFAYLILYSTQDYKQILYHQPVYIKKFSNDHESLTSKKFEAKRPINFIGLSAMIIQYKKLNNKIIDIPYEQILIITNLVDFLANRSSLIISEEEYNNLLQFLSIIDKTIKTFSIYITLENFIEYETFFTNTFKDVYGEFKFTTVLDYIKYKDQWLEKIKSRIR